LLARELGDFRKGDGRVAPRPFRTGLAAGTAYKFFAPEKENEADACAGRSRENEGKELHENDADFHELGHDALFLQDLRAGGYVAWLEVRPGPGTPATG
jgi:hypothetical protein